MMRSLAIGAVLTLVLGSWAGNAAAQSAERGKHVFRKCLLCHVLNPNDTDQLGPPLHDIIGRRAAKIRGFVYSDIMKFAGTKGFTWTREAMYYFLDKPEDFMPGTYMAFAGLEEQERRDVIAYLEKLTRDHKVKQRVRKRRLRRQRPRRIRQQRSNIGRFSPGQ